jgi:type 1 glutamine amidotransferase
MKTNSSWRALLTTFLAGAVALPLVAAEPKKVLVVTVTTGFRHSSIPTAEKVLAQLAEESGAFKIVDYARQPEVKVPQKPNAPRKPQDLPDNADEAARSKHKSDTARYESAKAKYDRDMEAWKTREAEVKTAQASYDAALKQSMDKLSPENLKKYDAVIFANTTGDLPLPDKQGFIDWVSAGHGFISMHSGTDTFHGFRPFIDMIGGEFLSHGAQVEVDCNVVDRAHPAVSHLGTTWKVYDEIYLIKSYDQKKVHELLTLDKEPNKKTPGHFPVSWCKDFGQGRVFYTSLGHREDVWDPSHSDRRNGKDVGEAYQKHILGGIKWALGLVPGDATPQAK